MSVEYTLNTFLRQTPKPLLKEYFHRRGLLEDFDFDALGSTQYQPVLDAMAEFENGARASVEQHFQDIFVLANKAGAQIMVDEAGMVGDDIAAEVEAMANHYHRAMWLFLNHRGAGLDIFETCLVLAHIKELRFTRSKKRKNLPKVSPRFDDEALTGMAAAISLLYKAEGRGYRCVVEHYERPNPSRHCYFAYPEDYTTSELEYTGTGADLQRLARKSVFQVVFVYRPDEGTLEISAPGRQKQALLLQEVFCRYALDLDGLPPESTNHAYELNGLKRRDFAFPTDPMDRIEKVELVALRLSSPYQRRRRVVVEQDPGSGDTLHDWMDEVLDGQQVPLTMMNVSWAKLKVSWMPEGSKRAQTLTFTLTAPDSSSLKDLPQHQTIKRYLKTWKIEQ